jgi:hypothetical protein
MGRLLAARWRETRRAGLSGPGGRACHVVQCGGLGMLQGALPNLAPGRSAARTGRGWVVLHLRGRSAGTVWGDLALRRINDWRASAGARSGALPSCGGAHSRQSTTPRAWGSMARTGAPGALRADRRRVWVDLGAKLWALAVSHPRLLRAHMIIPASAVGGVRMQ